MVTKAAMLTKGLNSKFFVNVASFAVIVIPTGQAVKNARVRL
jgi:hypothetical protein